MRYLALGDSYTIGEAVEPTKNWPKQLTKLLNKQFSFSPPDIVAKTGWTTAELKQGIQEAAPENPCDLVSLSIGVNNQYRGLEFSVYEKELRQLVEQAVDFADGCPSKLFVVSIPDYGVTPFAEEKGKDIARIAKDLDHYNHFAKSVAEEVGAEWIDITDISRETSRMPGMLAEDGLHPSAQMYGLWVERMLPTIVAMLEIEH